VKSTLLTVTKKLVLDGEPEVARCATTFSDHLVKIHRDGVVVVVEDDVVHPIHLRSVDGVSFVTCWSRA
jgi:hypothetical protein